MKVRSRNKKSDKFKIVFIEDKYISNEETRRRLNNAFDVIFKNVLRNYRDKVESQLG